MSRKTGPAGRRSARFGRLAVLFGVPAALLLWGGPGFAAGLTYNGSFHGEENEEGEFIQRRQQGAGLSLSHQLTNIISLREYARYTESWAESTDNKLERMTQGISLVADHDLWQSDFSAASNLNLGGDRQQSDSESYGARWKSKWETDMIPGLAVQLNKKHQSGENRNSEDLGMSTALDWRRDNLSLTYDYRWRQQEPERTEFVNTTISQDFQAGYTYSLWQNRLSLGLKHNYRTSTTEREAEQTGSVSLPVNLVEVRTGTDSTPADAFEDPSLTFNNLMDDSVLNVPAYSVTSNSTFNNMVIRPDGVSIDQIHIYTETDLGGDALNGLTWSVYTNDLLGTSWDSVPLNGISYNRILRRYELNIGELAVDYLKIVLNISLLGPDINFTEIEAADNVFLTSGSVILNETDTSQTGISLGARVTQNILLSYRADRQVREISSVRRETEHNELNQSGGGRYSSPDQTFSSSLTFSNRTSESADGAGTITESETRSYALDLDKQFLPTLSAATGIGKSENHRDSTKISESLSYRLDCFAQLYPDLGLNIRLNHSESTDFKPATKSDSNTAAVSLLSRLSPAITLSLQEDYSESGSAETYKTFASLNWQVSSILLVTGKVDHTRTESDAGSTEALDLDANLNLALTRKLLLDLEYNSNRAGGEVTETGEASLNWYPKSWLRLEGGVSYHHSPTLPADDYRGYGRADINFKLP